MAIDKDTLSPEEIAKIEKSSLSMSGTLDDLIDDATNDDDDEDTDPTPNDDSLGDETEDTDDDEPEHGDNTDITEAQAKEERIAIANYKLLVENGILPEGKVVKSLKDIYTLIESEKTTVVEEFKKNLPKEVREAIEANAKGIDYSKVQEHVSKLDYYNGITDAELQKEEVALKLVKDYLIAQGDDEDYINKRLAVIKDSDSAFIEGKRAKKGLVLIEENLKKAKEERDIAARKKLEEDSNAYVDNVSTIIEDKTKFWDTDLSTKEKETLKLSLFNPKEYKAKAGNKLTLEEAIRTDPQVLAQIHLLFIKGAFGKEGKLDFLKIKAKTNALEELDKELTGGSRLDFRTASNKKPEKGLSFMDSIAQSLRP